MNWEFDLSLKEAKKLDEMISAQAKKLKAAVTLTANEAEKLEAVFKYYRNYYKLTLTKNYVEAGINKSPTRDIILDYPWKDLSLNRFQCLKIWEKINH